MEPTDVWEALDVSDTGELTIDEFADGVLKLVSTGISPQMKRMLSQVESVHHRMQHLVSFQEQLFAGVGACSRRPPEIDCKSTPSPSVSESNSLELAATKEALSSSPSWQQLRTSDTNTKQHVIVHQGQSQVKHDQVKMTMSAFIDSQQYAQQVVPADQQYDQQVSASGPSLPCQLLHVDDRGLLAKEMPFCLSVEALPREGNAVLPSFCEVVSPIGDGLTEVALE